MASPLPVGHMGGGWNTQNNRQAPSIPEPEDGGLQVKSMGLKVNYTFDKDSKVNCLARHPQTLSIQTIPIDETRSIGLVDLRACIHAVTQCSPELAGQEGDFTIYAVDYSEEDMPLVGQGMLSWALESMQDEGSYQEPKMVTGRVTKNLLAVFGGGSRETLEVKLKLTEAAKVHRPEPQRTYENQPSRPVEGALTPTGSSEWNAFLQSNPQIGQQPSATQFTQPTMATQGQQQPAAHERRNSFGPGQGQFSQQRVAPLSITQPGESLPPVAIPPANNGSRPSSRASNRSTRKKPSTGRPRGRPRKKPAEGNTSGYEDGTEGEDANPPRKRAKITQVEKAAANPFGSEPESLRVAASTSGAIRNFRPVGSNLEAGQAGHLQEVPRAPTPVPQNPLLGGGAPGRGGSRVANLRRQSTMSQEFAPNDSQYQDSRPAHSPGQDDGRSPDSIAPTPNYSEDSPADIGSSPPVARTTPFIRSSPPPSSPILPPMPPPPPMRETSFMGSEFDDFFGDEGLQQAMFPPQPMVRKAIETTDATGVPFQVFRMESGPSGDRDMVHIRNYNTPQPTSMPLAPSEPSFLPPAPQVQRPQAKRQSAPKKKTSKASQQQGPGGPTPPPTTDAAEKAVSPIDPRNVDAPVTLEPIDESTTEPGDSFLKSIPWEHHPEPPKVSEPANCALPESLAAERNKVHNPVVQDQASSMSATSIEQALSQIREAEQYDSHHAATQPAEPQNKRAEPTNAPAPKKHPRQLNRSQSAGPMMFPAVPASEPAGPSSLSQSIEAGSQLNRAEVGKSLKRSASTGPLALPIPASDPVGPSKLSLPDAAVEPQSDAALIAPSSPQTSRTNKNFVKKHAIKQRLEDAIKRGEMPPFCSNCGAIETPTWRKIWVQDHEGEPEAVECSEKPGRITAIEILKRDSEDKPTSYRLVKKSLAKGEDRKAWQELLLCNPCGIWLAKCKAHRPADRWYNDTSKLAQDRRKRASGTTGTGRSKKARTKSDAISGLTSEAYLPTDALGPVEASSPKLAGSALADAELTRPESQDSQAVESRETSAGSEVMKDGLPSNPGSTHSRHSDSAKSPADEALDQALGSTRRLLFPSPRKDGSPKILGELDVNVVKFIPEGREPKDDSTVEKENNPAMSEQLPQASQDELSALFISPVPARPSTPPPNSQRSANSFKTPTRATPSHRPVTRSVSRSIRTVRGLASPAQLEMLQRTPTKEPTPRSARNLVMSALRRRSPRNHEAATTFENIFDTPITRSISQLLAEQESFNFEDQELDLSSLPALDEENGIDWGTVLSTDGPMPSSPGKNWIGFDYHGSADVIEQWTREQDMSIEKRAA